MNMPDKICCECEHYGEDGYSDSVSHKDRWIPYCDKGHYERVAFDAPACEDFEED